MPTAASGLKRAINSTAVEVSVSSDTDSSYTVPSVCSCKTKSTEIGCGFLMRENQLADHGRPLTSLCHGFSNCNSVEHVQTTEIWSLPAGAHWVSKYGDRLYKAKG